MKKLLIYLIIFGVIGAIIGAIVTPIIIHANLECPIDERGLPMPCAPGPFVGSGFGAIIGLIIGVVVGLIIYKIKKKKH